MKTLTPNVPDRVTNACGQASRSSREMSYAFDEALRRDPDKRRRWVVLVDGEPRQLKTVKAEARRAGVEVTLILDVVHVIEYLWLAGRALFGGSTTQTESWVGDRLLSLLTGQSGGNVARTIRWWAKKSENLDAAGRKAVKTAWRYLSNRNRTRLMHYAEALHDCCEARVLMAT